VSRLTTGFACLQVLFFRNGQITTGGKSLKDIDLKWWRSQIGLVQQEPFLFNDTILRNVQYGLVGTQWENESEDKKKELAEQACKEAFAEEFIARLPDVSSLRPKKKIFFSLCNC
jgi:ABC-type multidrug transport system fused ATPase/permease subunit